MNSLYDQMPESGRGAVAQLLGFSNPSEKSAIGFRLNLKAIAPLPGPFTIGDALRACIDSLARIMPK